MKKIATFKTFFFTSFLLLTACSSGLHDGATIADLVILNGTIIDGSNTPPYIGSVAVKDDKIVFVGKEFSGKAKHVIDASGLVVSPGFIDSHSHTDYKIKQPEYRLNESSITQGITTVVVGADGEYSPEQLRKMIKTFQHQGVATNVGFYVGHNGIRRAEMVDPSVAIPSQQELNRMVDSVIEGMNLGAVGFSTGLMYEPGRYSQTSEIIELTKAVNKFGGIYDSHVRDPINDLIRSDLEVIDIAREAKVAAKIAHVKAVCLQNNGASKAIVEMINRARSSGLNIVTDQYPYDGAKTYYLHYLINLTQEQRLQDLDIKRSLLDPVLRKQLQAQSEAGINGGFSWLQTVGYSCIRITKSEDFPELVGQYLSKIAISRKQTNFDLLAHLLVESNTPIQVTLAGVDEQDVQNILVQPWNMIVSDGRYVNKASDNYRHPRSTGTFPKVLGHYVRDLQLLTLHQAIIKMTSQPADFLGLKGRGILRLNSFADIVIFDPNLIKDKSTYSNPKAYSEGIKYVLVNGRITLEQGAVTGHAEGRVLRREKKTKARLW